MSNICPTCGNPVKHSEFYWKEDEFLYKGDQRINISPKELGIVRCLARAKGRVISREFLLDAVWPHDEVLDRTVDVHIKRARGVLGDKKHTLIEAVRSFGYMWNGPQLYDRK